MQLVVQANDPFAAEEVVVEARVVALLAAVLLLPVVI